MKDKIERSIRLLQMFASSIGGGVIELSYSGGKDSDVILELAKMAGIPFRGIYKATTIDPPGTIAHCRENGIEVVRPKRTFFELMSKYGFPTRYMRFCCGILKEYKILDNAIQGIRKSESSARNKRYDSNDPIICRTYGSKKDHVNVCLPILDWTDEDVEDFIKDRGITCHPVYYDNDGKFYVERRLGCIGCPLQSRKNRIAQFEKYPGFILSYVRCGEKYLTTHRDKAAGKKFANAWELFYNTLMCDTYEDFLMARDSLFDNLTIEDMIRQRFNL